METAAVGGGHADKFEKHGIVRSHTRVIELEVLKVWTLHHELTQWPLQELVKVLKLLDSELFEASLLVDRAG